MINNHLYEIGFIKKKLDKKKLKSINLIKNKIKLFAKKQLNLKNNFHLREIHNLFNLSNFNDFRLNQINMINKLPNINQILFDIFKNDLVEIFGPDISGQKNINLAIQRPKDIDRPQLHRDAPPGSKYEVVIWAPLVNCSKSMNMIFFPIKKTNLVKKSLLNKRLSQDQIAKKYGKKIKNVNYGEYLIFLAKVYHYIPINKENSTRWSLNFRYKNTFTPYGKKGFLDYFEPMNYSKMTEIALEDNEK
jgi:sporadic carbohydrate cluster 2OG-Fe(II) oxygenase